MKALDSIVVPFHTKLALPLSLRNVKMVIQNALLRQVENGRKYLLTSNSLFLLQQTRAEILGFS